MIRRLEHLSIRTDSNSRPKPMPPLSQRLLAVYIGKAIKHPYKSIEPASRLWKLGRPFKSA